MNSNLFLEKFVRYINQDEVTLTIKDPLSVMDLLTEVSKWSGGNYILYKVPSTGTFAIYDVEEEHTIYGYEYNLGELSIPLRKKLPDHPRYRIVVEEINIIQPLKFEKFIEKTTKRIFVIIYGSNDLIKMKEECDLLLFVENI